MSLIRLFTSGIHNGLTFTNDDIEKIAKKTADFAEAQIPFVLGHPKTNLPILGFLPKASIQLYTEGDKISLGFDKNSADMSSESMEALRSLGQNKLSVRLREGIIRHVGLVKKAAVSENNTQDFAALSGTFESEDLFFEEASNGIIKSIQNIFKPMDKHEQAAADFTATNEKLDKLTEAVGRVVDILGTQTQTQVKATITNDFASAEFSHLTDDQRKEYADFCASLPSEKQDAYKAQIKVLNVKPTPVNGSATNDFAAKEGDKEKQSAQDIIKKQMSNL